MVLQREEHRTLTKSERIHGIALFVAIITAILFLAAGFAIVVRIMIS